MPGGVDSKVRDTVFIIEGMYPWNSNGASPVVALMLALIANSVMGKACTQSFWSGLMEARMICMIIRFALSVTPSVWGWNAVFFFFFFFFNSFFFFFLNPFIYNAAPERSPRGIYYRNRLPRKEYSKGAWYSPALTPSKVDLKWQAQNKV